MSEITYPGAARVVAMDRIRAVIGILGRSGVGKSNLVHQLAMDPDYGPDEVLVLASENADATYAAPVHKVGAETINQVLANIDELAAIARKGGRLPKVVVWDSVSGTGELQMGEYNDNPILAERSGKRDKLAEYGDFGAGVITAMRRAAVRCPVDFVAIMRTHEPVNGGYPEMVIPGKMTPKNFVGLTSVCLHMRAIRVPFDPTGPLPPAAPHRSLALLENGKPVVENGEGFMINRYFYSQDSGEVMAKGHRNLAVRERAILPDILRKIKLEKSSS